MDNILLTCCILHNMLLDWSGRDVSMIAQGNWHAEGGRHDVDDEHLRLLIQKAHDSGGWGAPAPGGGQDYDASRVGFRNLLNTEIETDGGPDGWSEHRSRLVMNYFHRYNVRRDLHWLS